MILIVPDFKTIVFKQMKSMIIGSVFFTLVIISAFYLTVYALIRQKKLSEIKNDFINNMTHEFKTPLATISLAVDALRNNKVIEDKARMDYFSGIIKEEKQADEQARRNHTAGGFDGQAAYSASFYTVKCS